MSVLALPRAHAGARRDTGDSDVRSLRSRATFLAILGAFAAGGERFGLRLIHYSVLGNHLHLIVEAAGREALSRGTQGLAIRLARAINRAQDRSGRVFADHYFGHVLSTPAEVRHAIPYVEENQRVLDLPRRHAEHGRLGHDGRQSLLGPARRLEQPGRELALRPCTR